MKYLFNLALVIIVIFLAIFLLAQIPDSEPERRPDDSPVGLIAKEMERSGFKVNEKYNAGADAPVVVIFSKLVEFEGMSPEFDFQTLCGKANEAIESLSFYGFNTIFVEKTADTKENEYSKLFYSPEFTTIDTVNSEYIKRIEFVDYCLKALKRHDLSDLDRWTLGLVEVRNKELASIIDKRIKEKKDKNIILMIPTKHLGIHNGIQSCFKEMDISFISLTNKFSNEQ